MENNFVNQPQSPFKSPSLRRHFAPMHANISYPTDMFSPKHHSIKQMTIGSDGYFRATVDVHDYKPEEITVKTVGHTIIVELSHSDKEDEFGFIARKFSKKFVLPPNMNMQEISTWTLKGSLYLKVPSNDSDKPERIVEIKHE